MLPAIWDREMLAAIYQPRLIRSARGELGSCREYLVSTVDALADAGVEDTHLTGLLARVDG